VTGFDASGNIKCGLPSASLVASTYDPTDPGYTWGSYSGYGLMPGATFTLYAPGVLSSGLVASDGTIGESFPGLPCNAGSGPFHVESTTSYGVPISSNVVYSPCG